MVLSQTAGQQRRLPVPSTRLRAALDTIVVAIKLSLLPGLIPVIEGQTVPASKHGPVGQKIALPGLGRSELRSNTDSKSCVDGINAQAYLIDRSSTTVHKEWNFNASLDISGGSGGREARLGAKTGISGMTQRGQKLRSRARKKVRNAG